MEVSILGKGPSVRECQFDSDEIWGINNVGSFLGLPEKEKTNKRIDLIFSSDPYPDDDWIKEMKAVAPVISFQPYGDVKYPLQQIIDRFKSKYFCNTGSYALAYALYRGNVNRIKLYGCDQCYGSIYPFEHRSIEYWLGRIGEKGIEVVVPENSRILKPLTGGVYGMPRKYTVPLEFQERLVLMSMAPVQGHFEDEQGAQCLIFFLQPQADEIKKYDVKQNQYPNGCIGWTAPIPYVIDIGFTKEMYEYIKRLLIEAGKEGRLPLQGVSLYEKFVLNDIDG